jgi:3',5'-cyclic AMP phosphodiesterase CpdA
MPITLAPISRRKFLAGAASAGAAIMLGSRWLAAAEPQTDPHRLALLSDIHLDADRAAVDRGVVMFDHFEQIRGEVLALDPKPAAAFINGDCAHATGRAEDYGVMLDALDPIRRDGIPVHLTMGNHDNREHLWATIPDSQPHVQALPRRQIAVIEFPRANFFLLDSLQRTNFTPGALGGQQLQWLSAALDSHAQKPAIVMVHHDPDVRPDTTGLTDTQALLDLLSPRRHVKALIYGHTHHWDVSHQQGLHFVNLPAVAYVFRPGDPSGWVDTRLEDDGITMQLRCVDKTHRAHNQRVELSWRSR